MTAERRQKVLLGVLMVLLVFLAWRQAGRFLGGGGGRSKAAISASRGGAKGQLQEVVELRLDDLERQRGSFEPGRNPFTFGPPPKVETTQQPTRDPITAPPVTRKPPDLTALERGIQLPPIDLVYLGNFGPEERRIAVFSDGEEIFNAMIGDVLQEKFEVVGIGYESADLGYVDFPDSPPARLAVGG